MPPKAAPAPAAIVREGSKYMYIQCGSVNQPIIITTNSNCRIDVILYYCKKEFIKKLSLAIKTINEQPPMKDENGEIINNTELVLLQQVYEKLSQVTEVKSMDLIDINSGNGLNCSTNLANLAYESIPPHQNYKLGVIIDGTLQSLLIS